jgi:hypothetical protein
MVPIENVHLVLRAWITVQFVRSARSVLSATMKITTNYRLNIRIYIVGSKNAKGLSKIIKINLKIRRVVMTLDLLQTKS